MFLVSKILWGGPQKILDRHYKARSSTDHRAKFHVDRLTHLRDLALKKIVAKHKQPRNLWRPKSNWGEISGGWNSPTSKVTWPEVKCISMRRTRTVNL